MKNNKHGKKTHTTSSDGNGSVILLWTIVIGALAAIITALADKRISVAIIGIILIVTGFAAIATIRLTRETFVVALLPIVGIAMAAIPIYLILSEHNPEAFPPISDAVRRLFWGALAVFAGICITVIAIAVRMRLKRSCTCEVSAVCIHIDERRSRGIRLYAPQWEYYLEGRMYTHQETASSFRRKTEIGHRCTIMVNPDDPCEIYRRESKGYLVFAAMGVMLAFAGGMIIGLY